MKIIDTHCHPQFPQFDLDRDEVIRGALDAGIGMICVGTDLATSEQAIELAEKYEGLYASVGLHPNDLGGVDGFENLISHPKVVAVGEVGLDYYRSVDRKAEQIDRFKKFIEIAMRHDKPLIIHCRNAHDDMIKILPDFKGVIHSFTGTAEQARIYREKGYYIGLNGIVTFAKEYEEMVRSIPLDRMLLETDSPYLAPAPHRGKRNEPSHVAIVGSMIANIIGEEPATVFGATTSNAHVLFGMKE